MRRKESTGLSCDCRARARLYGWHYAFKRSNHKLSLCHFEIWMRKIRRNAEPFEFFLFSRFYICHFCNSCWLLLYVYTLLLVRWGEAKHKWHINEHCAAALANRFRDFHVEHNTTQKVCERRKVKVFNEMPHVNSRYDRWEFYRLFAPFAPFALLASLYFCYIEMFDILPPTVSAAPVASRTKCQTIRKQPFSMWITVS